jgi:cell division ATPase FtsA
MLSGIGEVAKHVFGKPVRTGFPQGIVEHEDMNHPMYAGSVGLLYHAARQNDGRKLQKAVPAGNVAQACWGIGGKMKQWLAEAF